VLLLDTHVCIWSAEGNEQRLGSRTRRLLGRAQSDDAVRISPVTIFEVTALHTLGRLRLTRTPEQWTREYLGQPGVRVAEFSPAIAIDAGAIPRTALADPLDRLLVATARQTGATFVTCDERILDYARSTELVRVHDGRR
jgi:PIN domain nuclease of toxin-antitoxin system